MSGWQDWHVSSYFNLLKYWYNTNKFSVFRILILFQDLSEIWEFIC